jgi:glutamine---fructose-6-phosphate transaminase (isomerizing)
MEEMIAAEPELVRSILGNPGLQAPVVRVTDAIRRAGGPARVSVVGCGTSEHAAMAMAALLVDALGAAGRPTVFVRARQAFEAALEPCTDDVLIAVSHEGETAATLAALSHGVAGLRVAITANPDGPIPAAADAVLATPLIDRSWCHTVGYVSPIAAGLRLAAALSGSELDGAAVGRSLASVLALRPGIGQAAHALASARSFVVCGSGMDAISARELALKIEEGVRLPAVARETETELHGHLVSASTRTALIAIITDPRAGARRAARADQSLRAGRRLGMPTLAIVSAEADAVLAAGATNARVVLPALASGAVPGVELLTSAIALQLLTLELLTMHGRNPDLIGRENLDQREAAAIASASFPI